MNNPKHIARTSDPVTSKQAASEVTASGRRWSQGEILHDWVRIVQGQPAGFYAEKTGMTMHQVSRRLADLKNAGKIHQGEPKQWNGRPQVTWWLGGDPEQQKPRPHCKSCSCYEEVAQIPAGQTSLFDSPQA